MVYKCKICGGQTIVDTQSGIATCEYCGTRQALPLFSEDSERLLYESGNNYLLHSEYDKAENVFNQLLTIKPSAAELYWDLVLCKYGVTYVKDPKTSKYIPTCNRTHYTPIFSDENYKKAIELSSGEKKALFEEDAKTIDNIQKGIIAVSKKEKPFDIFISYKETDANGNRTKDSIEAQKLYEKLTEAGYKVFFSRITLEDKIGTEYEPYIYAALYSSKVMLTVSACKENLEAVWVKNEWSRFLGFRQNDSTKTLLPLYFDMDKAELPDEFALLSAYDMTAEGFEEELLRGIKKLIPLPIMKAKRRKQILKATGVAAAALVLVAGVAAAIIIPKKMEEKRLAAEAAAQASEAAALAKANEEAYQSAVTLFDNRDYAAAEEAFTALGDYKDAAYMAGRCPVQPEYDAAMQLYYDGKYAQATWAFEALGDYEDAAEQKENAELSWRKSLATAVDMAYFGGSGDFYVTPNGTIANAETGVEVYKPSQNGKIISYDHNVFLYEDGTVEHTDGDEPWQDVIQIVHTDTYAGKFALMADGTVHFDENMEEYAKPYREVTQWKNIVMLDAVCFADEGGYDSALVGIDAEGNVFLHAQHDDVVDDGFDDNVESFLDHSDLFTNVKDICLDWDFSVPAVNAVALTNDGKLISYIDGKTSTNDAGDVVDVSFDYYGDILKLSADGKVYRNNAKTVLLNDAVKLFKTYTVTQSGAVYDLDFETRKYKELKGCKTIVHDEWLTGME